MTSETIAGNAMAGFGARTRLTISLAVIAFWGLLAFLFASQIYMGMLEHGHDWWRLFAFQLIAWEVWAPLTPIVLAIARRFPVIREVLVRHLLLHVAIASVIALLHAVVVAVAMNAINPYAPMDATLPFPAQYREQLAAWMHLDVLVYFTIVLLGVALSYSSRYRLRELEAMRLENDLARSQLESSRLEALLAKAQLEALQLRLNPHFLFNTLNAVSGLVRRGDNQAATRMLAGLSELLRYVLDRSGRQLVAFDDEAQFIRRYLEIQAIRFSDRMRYEIAIAPSSRPVPIPSMILQPLIENAVEHGIARMEAGGVVRMSAEVDERVLRIVIENDGPAGKDLGSPAREGGIGLENCRARLEEIYGGTASLSLEPRAGGGARATLSIPLPEHSDA